MGHVTMTITFEGRSVISGLGLATIELCTKFEISLFSHYENMKGDEKCKNWSGLGGHPRSLAT